MTMGQEPPKEGGDAYVWDQSPIPQDATRLWKEVANGIDNSQTGKIIAVML